jgi:RNA polymerase sigma factor (TIGR02999 family)
MSTSADITTLLRAWSGGDPAAFARLMPLLYEQLRRLAHEFVRREAAGQPLQATALVHEAYLRLVDARTVDWRDRSHFFAVSATIMRRILIDAARARRAVKRGGQAVHVNHETAVDLDALPGSGSAEAAALCALDDALTSLGRLDARRAQVVELRFFGGLTVDETAQVLRVSPQTVMRDWGLAKAWLARELRR